MCSACTRWQDGRPICAACLARLGERPSRDANLALALSTLGLCLGVPGVFGLVLGLRELGRIRRAEAPAAGQPIAELARNVGIVSILLLSLGVVWAVRQLSP
jgi:hypothetical protein